MGFRFQKRRRAKEEEDFTPEQKWSFVDLNDFKCQSYFTYFGYGVLWYNLIISIACYLIDLYILLNLLFFNHWSSSFQPYIPFHLSRWIFLIGILFSWANLAHEHRRAWRIIERDGVAESYLDSLAFRLQSLRYGEGKGWKRFLVFAELTRSKKGVDYIALFTQFAIQTRVRVLFCFVPLQIINISTLYSAFTSKLQASTASQIFVNMELLWKEHIFQAAVFTAMLFTFFIWVFDLFSLALAGFCSLFLRCYLPKEELKDGGLRGYCKRKINRRLHVIFEGMVKGREEEGSGSGSEEKEDREVILTQIRDSFRNLPRPPIARAESSNAGSLQRDTSPAASATIELRPLSRTATSSSLRSSQNQRSGPSSDRETEIRRQFDCQRSLWTIPPTDRQYLPGVICDEQTTKLPLVRHHRVEIRRGDVSSNPIIILEDSPSVTNVPDANTPPQSPPLEKRPRPDYTGMATRGSGRNKSPSAKHRGGSRQNSPQGRSTRSDSRTDTTTVLPHPKAPPSVILEENSPQPCNNTAPVDIHLPVKRPVSTAEENPQHVSLAPETFPADEKADPVVSTDELVTTSETATGLASSILSSSSEADTQLEFLDQTCPLVACTHPEPADGKLSPNVSGCTLEITQQTSLDVLDQTTSTHCPAWHDLTIRSPPITSQTNTDQP
ncbi:uncharacterized protein PAC_16306 [Phialocephala subalpina]|uniref:Uncharacterized protein n=1 Tax=Phialocephala subalpina TaxID=576137 RepID=A0A1L7XMY0_9HELO|nr:uncharacterized protein PAC_16306 [Phialocephala subalpina]